MHNLESGQLIFRAHRTDELETIFRVMLKEIEGESFTYEDFEAELQFDKSFAQQQLGQIFGRPSIFLKPDQRYIGYCILMPRLCTADEIKLISPMSPREPGWNSVEAEIGWAISYLYRNQGLATEAARLLVDYCFSQLKLRRVIAFSQADNPASVRVMHKLGMRTAQHPESGSIFGMLENLEKS